MALGRGAERCNSATAPVTSVAAAAGRILVKRELRATLLCNTVVQFSAISGEECEILWAALQYLCFI